MKTDLEAADFDKKEVWKDIKGYGGYYRISNLGRVMSLKRGNEYLRKLTPDKDGYLKVSLSKGKKEINNFVHRLVASAFIPNDMDLPQVNHIDGNKTNNHATNLEWVTSSENNLHAHKVGLSKSKRGIESNFCKITEKEAKEIYRLAKEGQMTQFKIAEMFNVHFATVSAIKLKKSWKHIHEEIRGLDLRA